MSSDSPEQSTWSELCATALESVKQVDLPSDFQIPALPTALTRFVQAAEDPNVDVRVLGQIVERDPGLTIDLLKFVNSAALGTDKPARTPTEAMVRLGIPRAKNFLISAGVKSTTLGFKSKLMNYRNFWNESLQRALFAQAIARSLKTDFQLAFMGGLLQDFMLPVLTNRFTDDYLEFFRQDEPGCLHSWEEQHFGWSHAEVGATVAHGWRLPDELVCCIHYHHKMQFALQSRTSEGFELFPGTLSALLPDQLGQVPNGIGRLLDADARSAAFDLKALCADVDRDLESFCEAAERPACLAPVMELAAQKRAANVEFVAADQGQSQSC